MRRFSFHAKNIGSERYLTYIMGEGSELDEETLDFMEEEPIKELVGVIFEQDDDYDYLTYDISGKTSLERYTSGVMEKEIVLKILRNIALALISCKEQALHLQYILLHKNFVYIDRDTLEMQFICLPVESEASVATEFKGFIRQLIANFQYNINENLAYVGTLLAFINGDSFNLRNLVGLTEALMEDDGIEFDEQEGISTEDGEVISTGEEPSLPEEKDITSFMMDLGGENETLPEIGDDEEEETETEAAAEPVEETAEEEVEEAAEEEAEAAEDAAEEDEEVELSDAEETDSAVSEETEETEEPEAPEEEEDREPTIEELAAKAKKLAEEAKLATRGTRNATNHVKVSRAALIQNAAHEAEVVEETGDRSNTEMLMKADAEKKGAKGKKKDKADDVGKTETMTSGGTDTLTQAPVNTIKVNPYLIRETTEERTIITKNVFKIGKANRGVDYRVDGNGAISRQHAIITRKDDGFYIKDNKSTNHTFVNGKQLEDGEEVLLTNNAKIRLGDEEFLFKF